MSKPIVLFDVDGVLCDFVSGFLKAAEEVTGLRYTKEDVVQWEMLELPGLREKAGEIFKLIEEPGWARTLKPYPGAVEAFQEVSQHAETFILTSPIFSPTFFYDRLRWLWDHLGVHKDRVIFACQKQLVDGDFLIDDKPKNVFDWTKERLDRRPLRLNNPQGILWAHPYNEIEDLPLRVCTTRTNDWSQVIRMVCESQ